MRDINNPPILVSVKCLVFNHEPYLRQCLNGFVIQKTNFRFEVIVHDDCSTDGSAAIIREYAEKYPDIIKPIFEEKNCFSTDWSIAEKKISAELRGTYLAFCEGDDCWTDENKLQATIDKFREDDNTYIVYTNFCLIDDKGNYISRPDYENMRSRAGLCETFTSLLCRGNFIMTCTACYRKSVIEENIENGFDIDYSYSLLAASLGNCKYIDTITAAYRKNPTSLMNTQNSFVGKRQIEIRTYFFTKYLLGQIKKRRLLDDLRIKLSAIQHAQRNGLLGQFIAYDKSLIILYPLAAFSYLCKRLKILFSK